MELLGVPRCYNKLSTPLTRLQIRNSAACSLYLVVLFCMYDSLLQRIFVVTTQAPALLNSEEEYISYMGAYDEKLLLFFYHGLHIFNWMVVGYA